MLILFKVLFSFLFYREQDLKIPNARRDAFLKAKSLLIKKAMMFFACSLIFFIFSTDSFSSDAASFYFFFPDSSQNNLGLLKQEMDHFLAKADYPLSFQPFLHLTDFDRKLKTQKPAFLLLPEWYFQIHQESLSLRPILKPTRNNSNTYAKVLLASKNSKIDLNKKINNSLAMTTMGPRQTQLLDKILFYGNAASAEDLTIVVVPKDSDALFALALGQVDLAFVSKESLEWIKQTNPRIVETAMVLKESKPISMPALCYIEGNVDPAHIEKMKTILSSLETVDLRKRVMELLKINEWKTYSE